MCPLNMLESETKLLAPPQEQGVDFPVRGPEDEPPILTPPPPLQSPSAAGSRGGAALASAGYLPPMVIPSAAGAGAVTGGGGGRAAQRLSSEGGGEDPFAGMSEEDRMAVQAAMAEMDQEAQAVRASGGRGGIE